MRYFYTDALKAAWMHREFNIAFYIEDIEADDNMLHFECDKEDDSDIVDSAKILIEMDNGLYVHPDCHELLKPQEGDRLDSGKVLIKNWEDLGWWDYSLDCHVPLDSSETYEIIQRAGKAFFMPEIETNN